MANNKVKLIKSVVGLTAGAGASVITGFAIGSVVPLSTLRFAPKLAVLTGSFFMSSMVGQKVETHAEEFVQNVADAVTEMKKAINEVEAEVKSDVQPGTTS